MICQDTDYCNYFTKVLAVEQEFENEIEANLAKEGELRKENQEKFLINASRFQIAMVRFMCILTRHRY